MENTLFGQAARKVGASVAQQWIQKMGLAALVGVGVWGWNSLGRAKDTIIMDSVQPEFTKVNKRIDSVKQTTDSSLDVSEKAYDQQIEFQSAQLEVNEPLRQYILNKKRLSASAQVRAKGNRELLDGMGKK